jgi:hypothetical protein
VATNAAGAVSFGEDHTITPHNVDGLETLPAENITRTTATLKATFKGNSEPTTYFFEWGTNTEYKSGSSAPTSAGTPNYPPATSLSLEIGELTPETVYHYRVVAENGIGKTFGNDQTFKALPAVQSLTTEAASPVGRKFATLNASFQGDGTETTYVFEWGTSTAYGNKAPVPDSNAGSPSGPVNLSVALSGLSLETTYHFRISATNPLGTTKGSDQSFTTLPAVAGLVNRPATGISQAGITLNAEFTGNGEDTSFYFEYGLTTKYGHTSAAPPGVDVGEPTGTTPLSATITEYEAYSLYHYRVVAVNPEGTTKSADLTFQTLPAPLAAISGTTASDVGSSEATMEAQIDPNRWATVYRFEYGPTTQYTQATEIGPSIGSDHTAHAVSVHVSGLSPEVTYHFRVVAINFTGTAVGPDTVFKTLGAPRIDLSSSSAIGERSAHLGAEVNPNSGATTARFEYGTSTSYGSATAEIPVGSDALDHPVGADIAGLAPGTTYHFRAVATNEVGTTAGPDQVFTTLPQSAPRTETVTKCRKGFVRRHGRCVKRPRKHHRRTGHGHG